MKKIRILAFGNSFSHDALGLLHYAAEERGLSIDTVSLYISGCSLQKHYQNLVSGEAAYDYILNSDNLKKVSIDEALEEGNWDYISFQQASHESGKPETYEPYLTELVAHVRKKCPSAELLLHETWAYERDATHPGFAFYGNDQAKMHSMLHNAYYGAAKRHGLRIIPAGDVLEAVRGVDPFRYEAGGYSLCRDGFHMHLKYGRYLLTLTWLSELFSIRAKESRFVPGTDCDEHALTVLRETVDSFFQKRAQK